MASQSWRTCSQYRLCSVCRFFARFFLSEALQDNVCRADSHMQCAKYDKLNPVACQTAQIRLSECICICTARQRLERQLAIALTYGPGRQQQQLIVRGGVQLVQIEQQGLLRRAVGARVAVLLKTSNSSCRSEIDGTDIEGRDACQTDMQGEACNKS